MTIKMIELKMIALNNPIFLFNYVNFLRSKKVNY